MATKKSDLSALFQALGDEVDEETVAALPKEEQVLETIARELLKLERDLTLPGAAQSEAARVDRLTQFIADKDF
ncbi:MAG: hypothetical protein QM750_29455 [Rubrivivax sp.]